MMNGDLPDGWELAALGEVAQINGRDAAIRELPDDYPVTFLPMAAVDAEKGIIAHPEERPLKEVRKGFTPFSDGDVLFAKITPSMENGKAAIARKLKNGRGFGSTEFHVFRPKDKVISDWIFHFIRQESFRKDAKAHFAGTAGQLRVPASFLHEYPIPVPPLPEQERIVAKIEELFTQLEAGTAALERVQAGLKWYKASVLKAAVEGKLGIQNDEFRTQDDGQLPAGWKLEKLGSVFTVTIGGTPSRSKPEYWNGKIAWVSSGEVRNARIKQTRELITNAGLENSNAKLHPAGTVLLAMIGEGKTRGQAALLDIEATTNQNIASILPNFDEALPEWIFYWLQSRYEQTRKSGSGGMQYALNSARIRDFEIPLPPLEEQRQIVGEVERRLSLAAGVESTLGASLSRAGRLRQAILKSAFEGRLV